MSLAIWQRKAFTRVYARVGVARTFRSQETFSDDDKNILVPVEQSIYRRSSSWWPFLDKVKCIERTEELIRSVGLVDQSFLFIQA